MKKLRDQKALLVQKDKNEPRKTLVNTYVHNIVEQKALNFYLRKFSHLYDNLTGQNQFV